jgi:chorismate mutase
MELFKGKRPVVIAGPCSAETEEQVLKTAHQLKEIGVKIYRAGIWKPRTRPGNFEGVGSKGLEWLKAVKEETGLLTSTEVANTKHVYEALKSGVDILWIGARTSANPFAVQEIADSLKGMNIPVMIKNPVNPDLQLWIGAIERLQSSDIQNIVAIHRGFSALSSSVYRNEPNWQIPIDLKTRMPEIPIICDPSHIAGKRDLLFKVSQKAMDLNYEGLMIESHIDPDCALSDAKQQITPAKLSELIGKLQIRHRKAYDAESPMYEDTIEELRAKIDTYDEMLLDIVKDRMLVAQEIGKVKKKSKITILQTERWNEIMKKAYEQGSKNGISNKFIDDFYKAIHQESINQQTKILNSDEGNQSIS